jgi:hypothetical protein
MINIITIEGPHAAATKGDAKNRSAMVSKNDMTATTSSKPNAQSGLDKRAPDRSDSTNWA